MGIGRPSPVNDVYGRPGYGSEKSRETFPMKSGFRRGESCFGNEHKRK